MPSGFGEAWPGREHVDGPREIPSRLTMQAITQMTDRSTGNDVVGRPHTIDLVAPGGRSSYLSSEERRVRRRSRTMAPLPPSGGSG
jgi:hypothetical protein